MNLAYNVLASELENRLLTHQNKLSDSDTVSEWITEIVSDMSKTTMQSERSVELLHNIFLALRDKDSHFFLSLAISEICAELVLLSHAQLVVEIAIWKPSLIPRNFRKLNYDWVSELVHKALKDPENHSNALLLLGHLPDRYVIKILLSAIQNSSNQLAVIQALGHKNRTDAIKPLSELLSTADEKTKISIIRALGEIGTDQTIKIVVSEIEQGTNAIREECISALTKIGSDQAYNELHRIFTEISSHKFTIMNVLIQLNPVSAKIDLQDHINQLEPHRQIYFNDMINHLIQAQ